MKLEFIEVPATDAHNKTPDDKPAMQLADNVNLLKAAFDSSVGVDNEPVQLRDRV